MGSGSRPVVFQLLADQVEGLEDGVGVAGHGHDPLRDRSVGNVDLGSGLLPDAINDLTSLPYYGSYLFTGHEQSDGQRDIGGVCGKRFVNVGHGDGGVGEERVVEEVVRVRLFTVDGLFLGWLAGSGRLGQAGSRAGRTGSKSVSILYRLQ